MELAMPAMGDAQVAALEANLQEQRRPDVLPRWGELNWQLHETMYQPADRPITLKLLKNIHDKIDRYLRLEITMRQGRDRGLAEHEALVDCCRRRDTKAAVALLDRHIRETARGLIAALRGR